MERALARSRDRLPESRRTHRRIRLMIVDDSTVARAVLSRMVESDPAFEISAVAGTAEDAIDALGECRVDIVILDLEMPGAGGLKSIPRILAAAGGAKVMIVSSLADDGAEQTVAALALGAADTMPKPGTGRFNGKFSEILVAKLKALGHATQEPLASPTHKAPTQTLLRAMPVDPIGVLAVGASTGGIHALGALFTALPARIGIPILVTQHLPMPFMSVFARQLGAVARREAVVAEDGMTLLPDRIFIAPGDAHLTLEPGTAAPMIRLTRGRSNTGCMPSVDPMLASIGKVYGASAVGVVLSGMGRDGLVGAAELVQSGGTILAQDEASSVVWGMPGAVTNARLAQAVLPPEELAIRISQWGEGETAWT